ncbi:hypothetical protein ACIOEX_06530 [Streptomyces sp. NPDC087850]|uniref:hypothetical protein n=1 Tax=Streptomyces sp. NPDC087850 TaxID=3365809 RepID=UPI00380520DD
MSLEVKSILKKSALVAASTGLAVTGLAVGAGTAQADGDGPSGASNVRGVDAGNTDAWMDKLCSQKPDGQGLVHGSLNVDTGQFRDANQYLADANRLGYNQGGGWEYFSGTCTYPQSSTWSTKGTMVRTSVWIGNRGTRDDQETFVSNYSTTTSAKKSVGGSLDFSLAKSIFTGSAGGNFSYEWGWQKTSSFERRSQKTIPPCTQVSTSWQPYQRVVRVNPVFNVRTYYWNKSTDPNNLKQGKNWNTRDTWRDRGARWKKVYSYGYYIDGTADKLLPNGQPDGREDKWQENLDPKSCAR